MCSKEGRVTEAKVVDHIIPHKGDLTLLWDSQNNWQALCTTHHNSDKQRIERGGKPRQTVGEDGWPVETGQ
jgi:5-methylcytosine-specific restriction endonuclease McrA